MVPPTAGGSFYPNYHTANNLPEAGHRQPWSRQPSLKLTFQVILDMSSWELKTTPQTYFYGIKVHEPFLFNWKFHLFILSLAVKSSVIFPSAAPRHERWLICGLPSKGGGQWVSWFSAVLRRLFSGGKWWVKSAVTTTKSHCRESQVCILTWHSTQLKSDFSSLWLWSFQYLL